MERKSAVRGVFILTAVMMLIAAGSAHLAVVDFEDAPLEVSAEGWGAVHPYLNITGWDGGAEIIVAGGSVKSYQGGTGGSPVGNNLCLDGQGVGWDYGSGLPLEPDPDFWRFDFDPRILVDGFSIDLLDFGDYFPYVEDAGSPTASLIAYDSNDVPLGSWILHLTPSNEYDACDNGIHNLSVIAPEGEHIAYAEITFSQIDPGIAFDNIEFNYECDPDGTTYNLIADGGDEYLDVGGVHVWNVGDDLFVEVFTDLPDWAIAAIHIDVETNVGDIDQTKKNNPKPGKFQTKAEFDYPWVTHAGIYEFPNAAADGVVAIAAHAELWDLATETTMTIVSREGVDAYGPHTTPPAPPLGDPAWGKPGDSVEAFMADEWPTIADAVWISTAYYAEPDTTKASWRWFHDAFEVDGYPLGGTVAATSDNKEWFSFNGTLVGSSGLWDTISYYPITPVNGVNTLDFMVKNTPGSELPEHNPTGLIYKVEVDHIERGESGWGEGSRFNKKNWAMYIEYTRDSCSVEG